MADIKAIAEELVNPTVKEIKGLVTILKSEYDIEPAAIHQYLKGHASYTGELGDYVIYKYDGKNFPVLVNNPGYNPVFGDKAALKAI